MMLYMILLYPNANKVNSCLGWRSLGARREEKKLLFLYDVINNNKMPIYVNQAFSTYRNHNVLHNENRLRRVRTLPAHCKAKIRKGTVISCITSWEKLPGDLKSIQSRNCFKFNLRKHIQNSKIKLPTSKLHLDRKK